MKSKKREKRILCIIITICMLVINSEMYVYAENLYNDNGISIQGGVADKINEIRQKYDTNSYFSANGQACGHGQYSTCTNCQLSKIDADVAKECLDTWTCCAFARYVFYKIFGMKPNATGNKLGDYTADQLASVARPGDFIDCYDQYGNAVHYAIYLGMEGDTLYLYESNVSQVNRVVFAQPHSKYEWAKYRVFHATNYDAINASAGCSFKACIDSPSDNGYYYDSNVLLQCWAIDKSGLQSVKYSINGGAEKELDVHERPDVSSAYPGYPTGREGFRKEVSRGEFGVGHNTVKFTAYCNNGHAHVLGTKNMMYPIGYTVYGTEGTRGSVSDTNAVLYAKLVTTERSGLRVGIQVGTSSGNYNLVDHMDDMSSAGYSQLNANGEVEVWFDIQNELGVTLSKGTRYYYRFIASHNGNMYYGDEFSFVTTGSNDTTPPSVVSAKITSYDKDGYTVTATASDNVGVTNIKFPTWSEDTLEEDIIWYEGSSVENGTSTCRINVSDFANKEGYYWTDVRAYDAVGNISQYYRLKIFIDRTKPTISDVKVLNIDKDGYTLQCKVNDNVGIKEVQFSTCTSVSGRTDWKHYKVNEIVDGVATCTINTSDFGNKEGIYCTDIYACDTYGNITDWSKENTYYPTIDRTAPEISQITTKKLSQSSCKLSCDIKDSSKIESVRFGISVNGKENVWREADLNNGFYETVIKVSDFFNEAGTYTITVKATDDFGNEITYKAKSVNLSESDTVIDKDSDFPFSDVAKIDNNWKYEAVKYVYENEIMNGIAGTNLFAPDNQLNRAMFATVLYRMAGSPEIAYSNQFSDVGQGKYYTSPILWASSKGIVKGFSDGSYGVDTDITREQIAKMLYEYASKQGYNVKTYASLKEFTDEEYVSEWATKYMQWAVSAGMITGKPNGDGTFRLDPKGEATRAECAKMLMMFMEKYK